MQVRKQQLELDMEQQTGSKLEKEYVRAIYCHPAYLTYMQNTHDWSDLAVAVVAEYIIRNSGLEEAQLESRLPGEISITSAMQMTSIIFMAESEEQLNSLLMKMKEESEKFV